MPITLSQIPQKSTHKGSSCVGIMIRHWSRPDRIYEVRLLKCRCFAFSHMALIFTKPQGTKHVSEAVDKASLYTGFTLRAQGCATVSIYWSVIYCINTVKTAVRGTLYKVQFFLLLLHVYKCISQL